MTTTVNDQSYLNQSSPLPGSVPTAASKGPNESISSTNNYTANKKSFLLYKSQRGLFELLNPKECKQLLLAMFDFESGIETELSPKGEVAFVSIKDQLKRDLEKWEANSEMRKEFGRRGGLAKASLSLPKASKSLAKLSKPAVDVDVIKEKEINKENISDTQMQLEETINPKQAWAAAIEANDLYTQKKERKWKR